MDLIASRAISWPLRTIDRNWSCSSCWVLLVLAIVCASLLASSANFTKHCLACQAEMLDLFCGDCRRRASAGAGGLRRAPGGGRLRGALGGRGLSGALGGRGLGCGALRCRGLARGGLGLGGLGLCGVWVG